MLLSSSFPSSSSSYNRLINLVFLKDEKGENKRKFIFSGQVEQATTTDIK
jgi:hypothetical protein